MPSILPDFEYDVFISYRHNDNRSGWVTEFVRHLNEELAATIKERVSVYFDSNIHDGLLETHHVDKSLARKLNSAVFVPVLSQIYCDTQSFAWKHEFQAFNRLCQEVPTGRDIRLKSGNVASRILPVMVNHLDQEDTALIETELKAKLRSIDFTFRSPGVNRPLRKDDQRSDNVNHLSYHDQLNKLANAIREIIYALKNPRLNSDPATASSAVVLDANGSSPQEPADEKSIAVLPFSNLSHDPSQEYFSDGITENIIMQLATVSSFRVISRTSIMRFRNTTLSTKEIATGLGVKYLLAGSAQSHRDRVRISAQLIDATRDHIVWSKVFLESMDDIFAIQDSVATVVVKELSASITTSHKESVGLVPTKNRDAYDLFLKGRHAFNQWSVTGYRAATEFFKQAIKEDPEFRDAYSYLASSYSARMSWNGDLSPAEADKHIQVYLAEAWRRGPSDNDFLTKGYVEFFIRKDFAAAEESFLTAMKMNANSGATYYAYAYLLNMTGRFDEAIGIVEKARSIDPLTVGYFNHRAICLYLSGQYEKALSIISEAQQLYPSVIRFYDFLGRIFLTLECFEDAIKAIVQGLRMSELRPPSMVAHLSSAYAGMGIVVEAMRLKEELIARADRGEKGIHIYVVHTCLALEQLAEAREWMERARESNDVDLIWNDVDPLLKPLRDTADATPDFDAAKEHIMQLLSEKMPDLPYHNLKHVLDVRDAALNIAGVEGIAGDDLRLIELAALLHDIGFVDGAKDHESSSARMARNILSPFGYSTRDIETVCGMIMATKLPQSPATPLEKILCDADLDYLGRHDFHEIGQTLREELLRAGVIESEREWDLVQRTFLESHRYHTAFSQQNREAEKLARLNEIRSRLKRTSN